MNLGEFKLIQRFQSIAKEGTQKALVQGIGDDCAVIDAGRDYCLISTDTFNEDIHFKRKWSTFYQAGIKAATGGVSDIYAMGGECRYIFAAMSIPPQLSVSQATDFFKGVCHVADFCKAAVAGGDTTASAKHFSATITAVGNVAKKQVKLRSGVKPGDSIYLTGLTGLSMAGLALLQQKKKPGHPAERDSIRKHCQPMPCLQGAVLAKNPAVTAMIDVSDGLSSELHHLAAASGVRLNVDIRQLLQTPAIRHMAKKTGLSGKALVLNSGEEYELLFSSSKRLSKKQGVLIGRAAKGSGVWLISDNSTKPIDATGFDHFRQG